MPDGPLPVRLTKEQINRIDAAAKSLGTSRTGVIKICLLAFLQRFEREGLAMLPPDWEDRLRDLDGRTHRYSGGHRVKVKGDNNVTMTGTFPSTSGALARKDAGGPKGKRGKKGSK